MVTADILDRGKKLMTHKGLHFVLLAVTLIVFALPVWSRLRSDRPKGPTSMTSDKGCGGRSSR